MHEEHPMTHDKSHAAADRLAKAVEDAIEFKMVRGKLSPTVWNGEGCERVYRALLAYYRATDKRKKEVKR